MGLKCVVLEKGKYNTYPVLRMTKQKTLQYMQLQRKKNDLNTSHQKDKKITIIYVLLFRKLFTTTSYPTYTI